MKTISAYVARIRFGELLNEVYYRGEEVVVERKGKPMVKISKIERSKTEADFRAFRAAAGSWEDIDTEEARSGIECPHIKLHFLLQSVRISSDFYWI